MEWTVKLLLWTEVKHLLNVGARVCRLWWWKKARWIVMFCRFLSYEEIIRRAVWFISLWKEAYLPPWADCPSTSKRSAGSLKQTRGRRWEEWCRGRLLCTSWLLLCLWTAALQDRLGSSAIRFSDNGIEFAEDLAPELSWPKLSTMCHIRWCPPLVWQLSVSFSSLYFLHSLATFGLFYSSLTLALMQPHKEQGKRKRNVFAPASCPPFLPIPFFCLWAKDKVIFQSTWWLQSFQCISHLHRYNISASMPADAKLFSYLFIFLMSY